MPAVSESLRRLPRAGAWLVAALLLSLGGAGIISATSRPTDAARAHLTWAADRSVRPALDAARAELESLAGAAAALGSVARGALAALTVQDADELDLALAKGSAAAAGIERDAAALRADLSAMPGFGVDAATRYSAGVVAERAAMLAAVEETDGLADAWLALARGAGAAIGLTSVLLDHDVIVAEAARFGRADDWPAALAQLEVAGGRLADATAMRDRVAGVADVTILDEWLARNRRYDAALVALYMALADAGGRVTDAVRTAFAEEASARAQLPPDTRAFVLIVAELGRGGLNDAVIRIEELRGRLFAALATNLPGEATP